MNMNYCAIDFETATAKRDSACSVALIEVEAGKIVKEHYTLLQPPGNIYSYRNIQIHGIRPQDTKNAPTFARLWPQLRRLLEGRLVLAHNAPFDMGVIKGCIKSFDLEPVEFRQCCTVKMSRWAWPELENHRLGTVGKYLNIEFNHHNALDDALTCAKIPLYAARELGVQSFAELKARLGFPVIDFRCS
ncbi:MAG: 3'-5' exonuclease [Anaerovibrio sp.]|uniref:3'-5' exonuclease n=1 Tax=Anaerovibrio sp. TaxID=1872532 RepID=UPI0025D21E3B|nr:3'-5' exonuclease [Anaerovibrio sp.]MCR5176132.1 3'-5' exonuclease [Anaerovibrio sp.]